jgi:hypothetical protein
MKLNLVTLAVVVVDLSLFGMYAAHQQWTTWHIAGIGLHAEGSSQLNARRYKRNAGATW